MSTKTTRAAVAFAAAAVLAVSASAQEGQAPPAIKWVPGPTTAELGDGLAQIEIPEGYVFADKAETKKVMEMTGNPPSDQEVGLIAPTDEGKTWFVVLEYNEVGYVKDDDKDEIDADAILKSISEGTEAANEERKKMGSEPIHIVGWFEKPHYDSATHNLVWAIEGKGKAALVNYDVRLLGRRGYISATLVTDPQAMAADLPHVQALLGGFSFKEGNRYAEWKSGDKIAEYGLAALVAGGAGAAALKLGLFAQIGKLLAKGWKLVALGFAAVASWFKRVFGKKRQDSVTPIAP